MRFAKLQVPAYGPFTDFELVLPKTGSDFHLIHGPNEAGKSSLLRTIRALLFGIEGQTPDNFLHDYKQMRILGDLELPDGSARTFQRRKGNKNTLLDADGGTLNESELMACLGAVDEAYFNTMFGLGSDQLRAGADELLRGEGRLGEALFSASMGGTPVDQVIRDLKAEADEIFSGRSIKRLRLSLQAHKEALAQRKLALVKPEDWDASEQQLADALKTLADLQQQHRERINRKTWLERCRDALETVGKLRDHQTELAKLPVKQDLPTTFAQELLSIRTELQSKNAEVQSLSAELESLGNRMKDCNVVQAVLDHANAINQIHEHLAAYKNERSALAKKTSESALAKSTVESLCRDLGVPAASDELEPLRLNQVQHVQAKHQAERLKIASAAMAAAQTRLGELHREIEKLRAPKVTVDPDRVSAVKRLRDQAAQAQERASGLKVRRKKLDDHDRTLRELHSELTSAPSDFQQTSALAIPTRASIQQFQKRFDQAAQEGRSAKEKLTDCRDQIHKIETEIESLTRVRELPDLDQLKSARDHRERGWKLILKDWKGGGATEPFVEGTPLDEAYADAVADADALADRLRTDAHEVAQVEEKRILLRQHQQRLGELQIEQDNALAQADQLGEEWQDAWKPCAISPQSPDEMAAWREKWQEFRAALSQYQTDRTELESDLHEVKLLTESMAEMLASPETDFLLLYRQIDEELKRLDEATIAAGFSDKQIQSNEREVAELQASIDGLAREQELANSQWINLIDTWALPLDLVPELCLELLDRRRDLFREFDRHQQLLAEEAALKQNLARFEEDVTRTAESVGLDSSAIETLAATLWADLQNSEIEKRKLEALRENEMEARGRLDQANQQLAKCESEFAKRCELAGISQPHEVDSFAAHFDEARSHRERISAHRAGLATLARGDSVDDFVSRVSQEDSEAIEGELADLAQQLADLDRQLDAAREDKHIAQGRKNELERAGDDAARHEQRAQFECARMLDDARRFIQLQSAIALLRSQIDEFRSRNQGPLMIKSSHWFSTLTGGAFQGILASFADGDEPRIAGRRQGTTSDLEVPVSGMSEGTRDQLYLALRLAGLELHLQDHPPMPLILDDLLVHFDDHRAMQALRAFAEMSTHCQILLFTHHEHLVQLARTCIGQNGFVEHRLEVVSPRDPKTRRI